MVRIFHTGLSWSTAGAGGSGRIIEILARSLPAEGIEVEGAVLAPADVALQTGGKFQLLVPPGASGVNRPLASRRTVRASLDRLRPQIFASHFALDTLPVLDLLGKRPFVMHFHGPWAEESRVQDGDGKLTVSCKRLLERAVYRRADRIITLSEAFARILVDVYKIPRAKLRVVPGAVDLAQFHPPPSKQEARKQLQWPVDAPIFVAVRRLVPRMGLDNLIRALAVVRAEFPNVQLYIAGKGPLAASLQALVRSLKLEANVFLLGFVPEEQLLRMYQAADLNVVPTLALEGFGLAVAESLAAGTPTLVTPIGGLPEVIAELSPGLIARSPSAADLAVSLRNYLSGQMAVPDTRSCRMYAEANFGAELMARRTAAVYRELAG